MDSFFGIGLPELILILLLAGMVMGPQRIRQVARKLGRITAQLQKISREFARQLNAEIDSLDGNEVRDSFSELRQLQDEVQALRHELSQAPRSAVDEARKAVADAQQALSTDNEKQDESSEASDAPTTGQKSAMPNLLEVPDDPD